MSLPDPKKPILKRLAHAPRDFSRFLRRRLGNEATGFLRPRGIAKEKLSEAMRVPNGARVQLAELRNFAESEKFAALVAAAAKLEPNIVASDPARQSVLAPWHDPDYFPYADARKRLPDGPVRNVVLVPFGKMGGADYVAGILASALAENGSTVILRTELSDWDRPDWYPESVPAIDLSDGLGAIGDPARALYNYLRALNPEAIYNVNSRAGFQCFETYGARLAEDSKLFAYYFCADRTPKGEETGYPVWFIADLVPHLTRALVDSQSLVDTLRERYAMPAKTAAKLRTIYTPALSAATNPPLVDAQISSAATRARPRVLWAGRLDRQKRFDLLEGVARAMPEIDFEAWGKAVLGKPPPKQKLPANLVLNPPFTSYEELPLTACDGWLYTSAWDGLPTFLIECAAMGMPIVASAVGGVPELIDDQTGWPVEEVEDVSAYVAAVRAMLADAETRRERATALQARARARHSPAAFRAALADIG